MNYTDDATTLIAEGFNPLPLKADKSPKLPAGHQLLYERLTEPATLFTSCDKIGVACGAVSGNLECIDFDCHDGQDINTIFKAFAKDKIARSIIKSGSVSVYQTPSGGYHLIYRCQTSNPGRNIAFWPDGKVMIETRGQGQYIACDPSPGYELLNKTELIKISDPLSADDRNYLLDLARTFSQGQVTNGKTHEKGSWGKSWDKTKPFGRYNIEQGEEAKDLITEAGWEMISRRPDGVEYWKRPGKQRGISATWGKHDNMFFVFTGSAPPFTPDTAYSPVDILMLLKFKGSHEQTKLYLDEKYKVKAPETVDEKKPSFPIEVLPEHLRNFINELNRTLNYNRDFIAISMLFSFAVLNGNRVKLKVKNGWVAPSVFWFVAVGEPGTMKSHPISTILQPISDIDKISKDLYDGEIAEWEANDSKGKKPRYKQILVSDYTLEALHEVHSHNKRGIGMYKDEIVGFLNDMNKYRKGSDEQFWLESFNNKSYIVNRVSKEPIRIDNININIIGSIQNDVLAGVIKNYAGNGLVDRFLYTAAEDTIYPMGVDDIDATWFSYWDELLKAADRAFNYTETTILDMPAETLQEMIRIDMEFVKMQTSDEETQEIKNYLSKMKTYLPRFALLLAIVDYCTGIEDEIHVRPRHMQNSHLLCMYFINSARAVFNEADRNEEISTISKSMTTLTKAEKILALYNKGFKQVDISKRLKTPKGYVNRVIRSNK